jgi:hypothetical protein
MRGIGIAALLAALALGSCATQGADAPPGFGGRTVQYWYWDPLDLDPLSYPFTNVRVFAPVAGARCTLGFWDGERLRNDPRITDANGAMLLRIEANAKRATVTCKFGAQVWRREIERIEVERKEIAGREPYVATSFPPLIHVPGPDADAPARWDAWYSEVCADPKKRPPDWRARAMCEVWHPKLRAYDLGPAEAGGGKPA